MVPTQVETATWPYSESHSENLYSVAETAL